VKTKLLAATALCIAAVLGAGVAAAQGAEQGYATPKTKWGAPDLQGFWNNTSVTSMQRPGDAKSLVVS